MSIKISFVIGTTREEDVENLNQGYSIVSKLLLTPDDYILFHYREGDKIQLETQHGYRVWCHIDDLEVIDEGEKVIIIFKLIKATVDELR